MDFDYWIPENVLVIVQLPINKGKISDWKAIISYRKWVPSSSGGGGGWGQVTTVNTDSSYISSTGLYVARKTLSLEKGRYQLEMVQASYKKAWQTQSTSPVQFTVDWSVDAPKPQRVAIEQNKMAGYLQEAHPDLQVGELYFDRNGYLMAKVKNTGTAKYIGALTWNLAVDGVAQKSVDHPHVNIVPGKMSEWVVALPKILSEDIQTGAGVQSEPGHRHPGDRHGQQFQPADPHETRQPPGKTRSVRIRRHPAQGKRQDPALAG